MTQCRSASKEWCIENSTKDSDKEEKSASVGKFGSVLRIEFNSSVLLFKWKTMNCCWIRAPLEKALLIVSCVVCTISALAILFKVWTILLFEDKISLCKFWFRPIILLDVKVVLITYSCCWNPDFIITAWPNCFLPFHSHSFLGSSCKQIHKKLS